MPDPAPPSSFVAAPSTPLHRLAVAVACLGFVGAGAALVGFNTSYPAPYMPPDTIAGVEVQTLWLGLGIGAGALGIGAAAAAFATRVPPAS